MGGVSSIVEEPNGLKGAFALRSIASRTIPLIDSRSYLCTCTVCLCCVRSSDRLSPEVVDNFLSRQVKFTIVVRKYMRPEYS